jgi:hypothetical protein
MFTSICPKCGRDLPLSSPECPFCVAPVPAPPAVEAPGPQAPPQGYPQQAYPPYPPQGYPPQQYPQQPYPPQQYPPQQYPQQPYPPQGYPAQPYPPQAYPPQGYPAQPYPPQGYPPQSAPQAAVPVPAPAPQPLPTIPMPPAPIPLAPSPLAPSPEAPAEVPPPPMATYVLDDHQGSKGMPAWMGFLLAFLLFGGIVTALIWYTNSRRENSGGAASTKAAKAKTPAGAHPASKYLELSGFRFMDSPKKKPQVQFVCINHGNVDIAELDVEVLLRLKNSKPEDEPFGSFKVKIPGVGPLSSKEIVVKELNTKLKFFDLPDWQFVDAVVTITSPVDE